MKLRTLLLASAAAAALIATGAQAQDTSKPIRLIVPYGPGGPVDVTACVLAEGAKDALGSVMPVHSSSEIVLFHIGKNVS